MHFKISILTFFLSIISIAAENKVNEVEQKNAKREPNQANQNMRHIGSLSRGSNGLVKYTDPER